MFEIDRTICVCSKKDLHTWKVASTHIAKKISSNKFTLIVPRDEVTLFRENSCEIFEVLSEDPYTDCFIGKLKNKIKGRKSHRLGWYIQQFIKLNILRESKPSEIYLIWDADTIPIKQLSFVRDGKIGHYKGTEHHQPYFDLIKFTLGFKKSVDYSFVAQCFAIRGSWFHDFVTYVESRHQANWIDVFLDRIDFQIHSGFSEYETLGTFISHRYKDEIVALERQWYRHGTAVIGDISKIDNLFAKFVFRPFDFVAFESSERMVASKLIECSLKSLRNR